MLKMENEYFIYLTHQLRTKLISELIRTLGAKSGLMEENKKEFLIIILTITLQLIRIMNLLNN